MLGPADPGADPPGPTRHLAAARQAPTACLDVAHSCRRRCRLPIPLPAPLRGATSIGKPRQAVPRPLAGFSRCAVPLVWWVPYFSIFADLFLNSALALDAMQADGALDRCAACRACLAACHLGMGGPLYRVYQVSGRQMLRFV